MRWIGQIEMALEMLIKRAQSRFSHGSYLSEKQSIQWMMSDSAMELYAAKLMVLHAAYKIEHRWSSNKRCPWPASRGQYALASGRQSDASSWSPWVFDRYATRGNDAASEVGEAC